LKALQQLDLTGVIQIVCGNASDEVPDGGAPLDSLSQRALGKTGDHRPQLTMLVVQKGDVFPPVSSLHREPVAALSHEASARAAGNPPTHGVLPIRRMDHQFVNVVSSRGWTPFDLGGRKPANRAEKGSAVPGFVVEGFVDEGQ